MECEEGRWLIDVYKDSASLEHANMWLGKSLLRWRRWYMRYDIA